MIQYIFAAAVVYAILNEPSISNGNVNLNNGATGATGAGGAGRAERAERAERADRADRAERAADAATAGIQSQNNKSCNLDCSAIPYSECLDGECTDPYYTMLR